MGLPLFTSRIIIAILRVVSGFYGTTVDGLKAVPTIQQNRSCGIIAELGDILVVQAQQVEDIGEALAVDAGRGFELDLGLGAPGDT